MIGKRINGRYQILETIGGGGMANVYKAHDVILNRKVAVKVLRPQFSDDDEFIRRFRREAQAATSLAHPNVVNIYDVGEEEDLYYIVMEYVNGLTLKQLISEQGVISIEKIVDIMKQITSAIAHAHANHIVHRDIKPHNILISENGEAKVTDFGIARAMTSATITHTNSVMGSVHYLSPEQARGGLVNEKSDIYSLGVVLYEMVTGRVPFSGDTAVSIAIKHLQKEVPSPKKLRPSIPQSIENIILRATAKDPFHRYNTAKEMEADLQTALDPDRYDEERFIVPNDSEEVTKAIPIIKEGQFSIDDLEATKINKASEQGSKQDDAKNKKTRKRVTISIIAIVLLLGSIIAAFSIIPKWLHVDEVVIPEDLIGLEYEEAFTILRDLDLQVERTDITSEEFEIGHTVRTDPEAGRVVKVDSTVMLYVSKGRERTEMVDVTDQPIEFAVRMLLNFGFKEENIVWKDEQTSDYDENMVILQNPEPGTLIIPDETTVILTYSTPPFFRLQNLQGYTREEVRYYLLEHGLIGNYLEDEYSDRIPEGEVIRQNPGREELVRSGDVIEIVFSRGPEPEPEPILEPISTIAVIEVDVSEYDQMASIPYNVRITYNDSTTTAPVTYKEEVITESKEFRIPITVNPEEKAIITVYINDEQWTTREYDYESLQ